MEVSEEIKEPHAKLQALEATVLHDVEQYGACSLADKVKTQKLSLAVQHKLSEIRALTRDLELLYEELDSDEERQAVAAVLSQHKAEYERIQQAFKGAALLQRRAAVASAVEERNELLAGSTDPAGKQRALATQAGLVSASEGVTEGLRRTRQMLAEQLEHTSTTLAAMEQSHAALGKTKEEYHSQAAQLKTSKGLLGTLSWQQKAERVMLWVGLALFMAVVIYVVQKRVGYFVPAALHPTALISTAVAYLRPAGSGGAPPAHLQPLLPSGQQQQPQQPEHRRPGDVPGLPPHFEHRHPRPEHTAREHMQHGDAMPQTERWEPPAHAEEPPVQVEEASSHPEHAAEGWHTEQGAQAFHDHPGQHVVHPAAEEPEPVHSEREAGDQNVLGEQTPADHQWEQRQQEEQRQLAAAAVAAAYEQQRAAWEVEQQQAALQAAAQHAAQQAVQQAQRTAMPSQELPQGHVGMPGGAGHQQGWGESQLQYAQEFQQHPQHAQHYQQQHTQHVQHAQQYQQQHTQHVQHAQQYQHAQYQQEAHLGAQNANYEQHQFGHGHGQAAAVAPEGAPAAQPEGRWQHEPHSAAVAQPDDYGQEAGVATGGEAPVEVASAHHGVGARVAAGGREEL